jgi:GTP:adenosylcobinamide-phosphate guanylyltransferase
MAGSRGGGDPLAMASGVASKALAPVAGTAMLARVLRTLDAAASVERVVVCGLDNDAARDAIDDASGIEVVPGEGTPGASAATAIATLGLTPPLLVTTADHPLLAVATVDAFCERAAAINADVTFGLVPAALVHAAFPAIRRTAYRFRDGGFVGCNLYALLTPKGCEAPALWAEVEAHRKRPWRLVGTLGYGTLLRFFLGRLALADLTGLVFARTGLRVRPIFLTDPAAGFDVDTPEQHAAAEAYLLERESRRESA